MRLALFYLRNHHLHREEDLVAVEAALAAAPQPFWLDVEAPGVDGVAWLADHFPFHPLALEDLLRPNLRPKLEEYEGHLFLIAHAVGLIDGETVTYEMQSFLTRKYLVTVHDVGSPVVAKVQRTVAREPAALGRGPDHVLYLLLNEMATTYFDLIDDIDDTIDLLEAQVLSIPSQSLPDSILGLRRGLATTRRLSSHQRDALNALVSHEGGYVRRPNVLYLRDVQNLMVTVHEMVDSLRDLTSGVLEIYLSTLTNRLNDIMRRLTIVATVFLPISFIAGLFGTNFVLMPFQDPAWFWVFLASLALTPAGMLTWFRRLGWL